jgi:hypothetical protein
MKLVNIRSIIVIESRAPQQGTLSENLFYPTTHVIAPTHDGS